MTDDAPVDWGAWDAPLTEQVALPSTGRPAELHKTLRVSDIVRRGLWTDAIEEWFRAQVGEGTISADRAVVARDRIVVCTVVRPQLVLADEEAVDGAIPVSRLTDDEIDDIVTFALGGRAFMEAFRGVLADAAASVSADEGAPLAPAARKSARPAGRRGGARPAARARGAA